MVVVIYDDGNLRVYSNLKTGYLRYIQGNDEIIVTLEQIEKMILNIANIKTSLLN